jgi:hypothetical protein
MRNGRIQGNGSDAGRGTVGAQPKPPRPVSANTCGKGIECAADHVPEMHAVKQFIEAMQCLGERFPAPLWLPVPP